MIEKKLSDYIDINPATKLEKGKCYPFVEMENIVVGIKRPRTENVLIFTGQSCSKFKPNDTLMARITPCLENGKVAKYSNGNAGFGSTEFIVFRGKSGLADDDYVYYLAKSQYIRDMAINSMTGASGRQRADAKFIGKIKWNFPSPNVQTKIASILSDYDDLIENNNKRIKILEQMAENLYKEWFVRFRFPGYETAEFENGIPKGWNRDKIHTYYNTCSGGTPNRGNEEYFENGVYPWVKTGEIKDCVIIDTEEYITQEAVKKSSAKILPSKSLAMAMYGVNIGLLAYLDAGFTCNQACCVFVDKRNFSSINYLYQYLKSIREYLLSISFGAAQQNISQEIIRKIKIIMPSNEIITAFEKQIDNIYSEIRILLVKNKNLTVQRDSLLPRLMSGKLEV